MGHGLASPPESRCPEPALGCQPVGASTEAAAFRVASGRLRIGSCGKWVDVDERLWSNALLAALPFCLAGVKGSAGWSLCRSCLGHHEHSLRPWVDEARMAFALLLCGGRCAPLSAGFGRWFRYWWMALRLSTRRIYRPPTKPLQERRSRGSQEAPPDSPDEPLSFACALNFGASLLRGGQQCILVSRPFPRVPSSERTGASGPAFRRGTLCAAIGRDYVDLGGARPHRITSRTIGRGRGRLSILPPTQ